MFRNPSSVVEAERNHMEIRYQRYPADSRAPRNEVTADDTRYRRAIAARIARPFTAQLSSRGSGTAGRLGKRGPRNLFTLCFALAQAKTTRSTFAADLPPIKCKSAPSSPPARPRPVPRPVEIGSWSYVYLRVARRRSRPSGRYRATRPSKQNSITRSRGFAKCAIETRTSNANAKRESIW